MEDQSEKMIKHLWKGIAAFFAAITLAAAAYIGVYLYQSSQNAAFYDDIMTQAKAAETQDGYPALADLDVLQKRNPDCIGVVYVPGTKIYYPVVQSKKEKGQYYLHRNFDRERSAAGTPFLDVRCDASDSSKHQIVYAHHMRNGQMFAALKNYQKKSYWQEHPTIRFQTEEGTSEYEIFSAFRMSPSSKRALSYLNALDPPDPALGKRLGIWYDSGITPEKEDAILTLITCDYAVNNGRMVVTARRIPEKE